MIEGNLHRAVVARTSGLAALTITKLYWRKLGIISSISVIHTVLAHRSKVKVERLQNKAHWDDGMVFLFLPFLVCARADRLGSVCPGDGCRDTLHYEQLLRGLSIRNATMARDPGKSIVNFLLILGRIKSWEERIAESWRNQGLYHPRWFLIRTKNWLNADKVVLFEFSCWPNLHSIDEGLWDKISLQARPSACPQHVIVCLKCYKI